MQERPFPPSPRRLALARASGLTAASPLLAGALACGAILVAAVMLAGTAASRLGAWIAGACGASVADVGLPPGVDALDPTLPVASVVARAPRAVLDLALPLLATAALVAIAAHVAQTRALWLPRRRVPGAPTIPANRASRGVFELACAGVVGTVAFGWLWLTAPDLAGLVGLGRGSLAGSVAAAIATLLATVAIAWLGLAVLDALARRAALHHALSMTAAEKREDDRLAAADPRWRAQRALLARGPAISDAVARAAVVILGDDIAVAIAWHATRQPAPLRVATGRRARATQLLGLARRHRVAVHRDATLAAALVGGEGPVPDAHWARLAEIVAAVGAR